MSGHTTDLGVEVVNGWPIHKRECDDCQGDGRVAIEVGPPHAPRDYYEPCERCRGEGFLRDEECVCPICVQVAEDREQAQDQRRRAAP